MVTPEILNPTPIEGKYLMQIGKFKVAAVHPDQWIQNQPKDVRLVVYQNRMVCPACNGRRTIGYHTTGETGESLYDHKPTIWSANWGIHPTTIPCLCTLHRIAWRSFRDLTGGFDFFFDENVQLDKLQPYGMDKAQHDFSAYVLERLRANPLGSYFFVGPPHRGKTTFSRALTREAVRHQVNLYVPHWHPENRLYPSVHMLRQEVNTLTDQWHKYMMTKGDRDFEDPRLVTIEKLTSEYEDIVRLHLSEMDKIGKISDFKRDTLHTILNTVYDRQKSGQGAQLVIDTNMSLDEFESGENFGDKIGWRIAEMCTRFDFFNLETLESLEAKNV